MLASSFQNEFFAMIDHIYTFDGKILIAGDLISCAKTLKHLLGPMNLLIINLEDLVNQYNNVLMEKIDSHTPLKSRTVVEMSLVHVPWITREIINAPNE